MSVNALPDTIDGWRRQPIHASMLHQHSTMVHSEFSCFAIDEGEFEGSTVHGVECW